MQTQRVSDQDLILRYLQGDSYSFEVLLRRHKQAIYSVLLSRVRDRNLADDLFQEVFIKIIKTIHDGRYNEMGKFQSYATRMARNYAIDYLRKKKHEIVFSSFASDDESYNPINYFADNCLNASQQMISTHEQDVIRKLIMQIPEDQREVLIMRHWGQMKFKDIAEHKGESINTIMGRMRYALQNMRKLIQEQQIDIAI